MEKYRACFKDRKFLVSLFFGFLFLALSLVANYYAGLYATEKASNAVTDIILSNIPVVDVDNLFVYGTLAFWILIIVLGLRSPKKIPFMAKCVSLFAFVRSIFISLTHIGPFPTQLVITSRILSKVSFGGDLFFSGHVGIPFLFALIFWDNRRFRYFFIACSVFFGVVVLLGHLHYSIDVLSAFFITDGIYTLAQMIFKKDKELFMSAEA